MGRHDIKFRLLYDVHADEFGLPHYSFVNVQGALTRQVVYSPFLSLLQDLSAIHISLQSWLIW